jgi:uncharacterized membrane protein
MRTKGLYPVRRCSFDLFYLGAITGALDLDSFAGQSIGYKALLAALNGCDAVAASAKFRYLDDFQNFFLAVIGFISRTARLLTPLASRVFTSSFMPVFPDHIPPLFQIVIVVGILDLAQAKANISSGLVSKIDR